MGQFLQGHYLQHDHDYYHHSHNHNHNYLDYLNVNFLKCWKNTNSGQRHICKLCELSSLPQGIAATVICTECGCERRGTTGTHEDLCGNGEHAARLRQLVL